MKGVEAVRRLRASGEEEGRAAARRGRRVLRRKEMYMMGDYYRRLIIDGVWVRRGLKDGDTAFRLFVFGEEVAGQEHDQ